MLNRYLLRLSRTDPDGHVAVSLSQHASFVEAWEAAVHASSVEPWDCISWTALPPAPPVPPPRRLLALGQLWGKRPRAEG